MSIEVRYISYETVVAINEAMTAAFGGSSGVRDCGLLESAIAQPAQTFAGGDLYPTIPEKAARLAFGIAKDHPFIDGNKRTAAACMAALLATNGYRFDPEEGTLADEFISLAAGEVGSEELKEWVVRLCVPAV